MAIKYLKNKWYLLAFGSLPIWKFTPYLQSFVLTVQHQPHVMPNP